jgi:hypothetical protein
MIQATSRSQKNHEGDIFAAKDKAKPDRKCKRLKQGGGQAHNRASDQTAVADQEIWVRFSRRYHIF